MPTLPAKTSKAPIIIRKDGVLLLLENLNSLEASYTSFAEWWKIVGAPNTPANETHYNKVWNSMLNN